MMMGSWNGIASRVSLPNNIDAYSLTTGGVMAAHSSLVSLVSLMASSLSASDGRPAMYLCSTASNRYGVVDA
ncbi:Uncharacterised protein [Chromobacterium violaceum]|uniref:Uncharacterized protein n=1 Tax=Chromobacterium violaceum TaxID=536 RepID=A0A447TK80_CHRVL|nr:Uncharacterised protein [Chromobacterium violaceum]